MRKRARLAPQHPAAPNLRDEEIWFRQASGKVVNVPLVVERNHHRPVVADNGSGLEFYGSQRAVGRPLANPIGREEAERPVGQIVCLVNVSSLICIDLEPQKVEI